MESSSLPLAGGLLLGSSAVWLLPSLGRIAGISGVTLGALTGPDRVGHVRPCKSAGLSERYGRIDPRFNLCDGRGSSRHSPADARRFKPR